jgi:Methylene-tetrahydrofolate reductase C terminal
MLGKWGKHTVFSRCVVACCPEEIMNQTFIAYKKQIEKSDVIVVLSCAAGIKAANLCRPDIPVVTVLDPVGSTAITSQDNFVANSVCRSCGSCVITFTGGICPISECPAKSKYGPCKKAPETENVCSMDDSLSCVWKEIEKKCGIESLFELKKMHADENLVRPVLSELKTTPPLVRKLSGRFVAHVQSLERIMRLIR